MWRGRALLIAISSFLSTSKNWAVASRTASVDCPESRDGVMQIPFVSALHGSLDISTDRNSQTWNITDDRAKESVNVGKVKCRVLHVVQQVLVSAVQSRLDD